MDKNYIDLGLPSGTLWADTNEKGFYTFDEAVKEFGKALPSIESWEELIKHCTWTWDKERKGYVVTGKNGNRILLPFAGIRDGVAIYFPGAYGYYWSSSLVMGYPYIAWNLCFGPGVVNKYPHHHYYGDSVRLIKV